MMEGALKRYVQAKVEARIMKIVEITDEEWEEAKRNALTDIYANQFCFLKDVSLEYFTDAIAIELSIIVSRKI